MSPTQTSAVASIEIPAKRALNFMLVYIIFIYAPFTVALLNSGHDVWRDSLSGIGWQHGGLRWFFGYGILALPFVTWQGLFNAKFNPDNRRLIVHPLIAGCVIIGVGMFFPDPGYGPSQWTHCAFDDTGSTIAMLAVTATVVQYCRSPKWAKRRRVGLGLTYGACIPVVVWVIITQGPVAAFEVLLTLGSMLALYFVNKWTSQPRQQLSATSSTQPAVSAEFH
ncbi:MAG: hypothetical protein FWD80_02090 [Propionibacteriaceae bacterium]|nr:hypothetical protein [Propionibacteriaceae bacterium]